MAHPAPEALKNMGDDMNWWHRLVGAIVNSRAWRRLKAEKAVLENETIDPAPRSAWVWLELFVIAGVCVLVLVYCGYVVGRSHGMVHEVVREKQVAVVPDGLVSVRALEAWKNKAGQCDKDLADVRAELNGRDPPSPPLGRTKLPSMIPFMAPGPVEDVPVVKPKHWPKPCAKNDGWCDLSTTMSKAVKSVQKSVGAKQ